MGVAVPVDAEDVLGYKAGIKLAKLVMLLLALNALGDRLLLPPGRVSEWLC